MFGSLLLCRFVGFTIVAGLLVGSYSSLLRVRSGVRVRIVLLLPGFFSHTACGAAVQLLRSCCESGLCHLCSAVCCSADSSGLPSLWGCRAVAVHPCYDSDQASGFRSCCWSWTCCCNDTGTEEANCKYGSPIWFFKIWRTSHIISAELSRIDLVSSPYLFSMK